MRKILLLMLVLLSGITGRGFAHNKPEEQARPSPLATAEKLLSAYDNEHSPGALVMVMLDGQVIYQKAVGMASLSHGIPYDLQTPANIGSTAKQFTAFAIGLMAERGQLSLEDDIRLHIPELPDLGHTVQIKHLISHTSGYREYLNTLAMAGRNPLDPIRRQEIIQMVQRQEELQNVPGEVWNYNNTGYALLATVIERISGMDFAGWMQQEIFLPLSMENTRVRRHAREIIPRRPMGYLPVSDDSFEEAPDLDAAMGAGGMYTTLDDLTRWINHLFEPVLGSGELMARMTENFILNGGDTTIYGMGLMTDSLGGLLRYHHGGADLAHRSQFMIFPQIKGAVVTQSNHGGFMSDMADKLAMAFFKDVMPGAKHESHEVSAGGQIDFVYDTKQFDEIAGRYALDVAPNFVMEFSRDGDQLFIQATGQPRFEIYARSDSTFAMSVVEAAMTFHRNAEGIIDAMTLHQNGDHRASRLIEEAWKPSEEDKQQYCGLYLSLELEAFYTLAVSGKGELELRHTRMDPIVLKAEESDIFSGSFPIMGLHFERDEDNKVTGFKASSGRTAGVWFEKQTP